MEQAVLAINAGSSSIKFAVFVPEGMDSLGLLYRGYIEGIGQQARFVVKGTQGTAALVDEPGEAKSHRDAIRIFLDWFTQAAAGLDFVAAGHRIVHGGTGFHEPVIIDDAVTARLERLIPLAPLHQPHNLAAIAALQRLRPHLIQVACFDTAFHHSLPSAAQTFAIPGALRDEGVRPYGFHGLSYEYIAGVLPDYLGPAAEGRVVVAHLGFGASMCAMKGRRSVATTMTFTPLDGLPMGSRCGALDPAVVFYLMREKGMDIDDVSDLLHHRSGLLGLSGISGDMRRLLASGSPRAKETINFFVYRAGRELGSLAAALGGLDALVFTAGIGEHAAAVRARICRDAAWLGIRLDEPANDNNGPRISPADDPVSAWVIPTNEERVVAGHALGLAQQAGPG